MPDMIPKSDERDIAAVMAAVQTDPDLISSIIYFALGIEEEREGDDDCPFDEWRDRIGEYTDKAWKARAAMLDVMYPSDAPHYVAPPST